MVGAILAGGAGRRMGGGKPVRLLQGRPLIEYPLRTLAGACERVVVVAKASVELPPLGAVERWDEPDEPRHPAAGIAYALERAGEPLLVCGADMPYVTEEACLALVEAAPAVGVTGGRLQPLLAAYAPAAARALRAAAERGEPLTRVVESLGMTRVELPEGVVRSIDTPDELESAQ
ncbi:MAG: molybdenum cofactor guanylyltransferase [Thermoleophilaceae bacterium]|jgi:molybdopterin-guanine dinucleotide biosynthesis protein A|nr:molybdenum cofactor guanylyltransferase [Thermoleophilaceae bacterium]